LEYGTLLGYIREKKILSGDDDIDLSTYLHRFLPKYEPIKKELFRLGYDVYITKDKLTIKKQGKHASVYFYHRNKDHISRHRISKKDYRAHILLYGFLEGLSTPAKDKLQRYTPKKIIIQCMK